MQKLLKLLAVFYLIALALLMLVPIGNSSTKLNDITILSLRGDYLVHVMVALPWMWVGRFIWREKFRCVWWFILGIIMIAAFELAQMCLPYRAFNINDLTAGVIGVIMSLLSMVVLVRLIKFVRK